MADQIYTRLASEDSSGNHIGDVVLTGYSELSELVRQQRLQKDIPATSAGLPEQYLDPAGYFQLPWVNAFTVGYNTQKLKPEEVPDTWAKILDPQRKNTFAHVRFYGASPFDAAVILLQEAHKLSDADLQTLHDNAQVADNPGTLISNLAQGRTSFVLWAPAQGLARMRDGGAPIGLAFPKDVAILYGPGVALIKHAPHPAAAQLFKNWLFTPTAQAIIAHREYAYGTVPGSPAPEGFPDINTFKQTFIPYDQVNAYFDRYRSKTAAIWK
jgi:iron(III) transport system substrate-binding protein